MNRILLVLLLASPWSALAQEEPPPPEEAPAEAPPPAEEPPPPPPAEEAPAQKEEAPAEAAPQEAAAPPSDAVAAVPIEVSGTFVPLSDKSDSGSCGGQSENYGCRRLLDNGPAAISFVAHLKVTDVPLNVQGEAFLMQHQAAGQKWTQLKCRAAGSEMGADAPVTCTNVKVAANTSLWLFCVKQAQCNYTVKGEQ